MQSAVFSLHYIHQIMVSDTKYLVFLGTNYYVKYLIFTIIKLITWKALKTCVISLCTYLFFVDSLYPVELLHIALFHPSSVTGHTYFT